MGFENEFVIAMVNEPSVLEPLKFYCNSFLLEERFYAQVSCLMTLCICIKEMNLYICIKDMTLFQIYYLQLPMCHYSKNM